MSFRRVQSWVWLLLPFLVARALVPAGFMAQAVEGRLQIVFCHAGSSQPVEYSLSQQLAGAGHDAHDDQHKAQNDFSCPFAVAAAAPLQQAPSDELIAFTPVVDVPAITESPYMAIGPPRILTTRGPPTHV